MHTKISVLMMVSIFGLTLPVMAEDFATGEQIRKYVSGNTYEGASIWGFTTDFHDPAGKIINEKFTATWEIQGDSFRADYGDGLQCWQAKIDGRASVWYKDGTALAAGIIFEGNPKNLK